jgi:hypothetical protein
MRFLRGGEGREGKRDEKDFGGNEKKVMMVDY